MVGFLVMMHQSVVDCGIGFLQVRFFEQFFATRTHLRG
jgi:hypothetical protein